MMRTLGQIFIFFGGMFIGIALCNEFTHKANAFDYQKQFNYEQSRRAQEDADRSTLQPYVPAPYLPPYQDRKPC